MSKVIAFAVHGLLTGEDSAGSSPQRLSELAFGGRPDAECATSEKRAALRMRAGAEFATGGKSCSPRISAVPKSWPSYAVNWRNEAKAKTEVC